MTRGLITIATGNEHYYKIAANLLLSYRMFSTEPLPFAIIAEEENEYTALFDKVILTNESYHSFMDKLLLLKLCPFDENLFFDADSLAFGDLNRYWDLFSDATDFSSIGKNVSRESEGAWYNVEDIWKYGDMLEYKVRVHMGVCFIRKSEKLKKLYEDCMDVFQNFDKLHFHSYPNSVDECVLGVAMPMNGMKATRENYQMLAAYPCLTFLKANILKQQLTYATEWGAMTPRGLWLHFGTTQTHLPLYRFNAECLHYLDRMRKGKTSVLEKMMYEYKLRLITLVPECYISILYKRIKKLFRKVFHVGK